MGKINITLYSNYQSDMDEEYMKEYYQLYLKEIEKTEEELPFDDFIEETREFEYEAFFDNIRYSPYSKCSFVILGTLGLWNGNKTIVPMKVDNLYSAIYKCIKSSNYFKVKQVNGHVEISASHHDGINTFQIYLLNDKGINTEKGDLSNKRYHKAMKGYIF